FVVVLGDLDENIVEARGKAQLIAEKVRLALSVPYRLSIAKENRTASTVEHTCSASIGVALFVNQDAPLEDIMKGADAAMYQAKSAGRNSIRFYESEPGKI
ncbi:MAG: diguanylate cyclase, partial [Actinomycetota bacterium]